MESRWSDLRDSGSQWFWCLNGSSTECHQLSINRGATRLWVWRWGSHRAAPPHFHLQSVLSWNHTGAYWGKRKKTIKGHDSYSLNNRTILITIALFSYSGCSPAEWEQGNFSFSESWVGSADASSRRVPTKDTSGDSSSVSPFLSTDKPSGRQPESWQQSQRREGDLSVLYLRWGLR